MRLLEPINGIKVAQGHMLIHMVFFVTMMTLDTNIDRNRRDIELGI
jgi:hypothetical protein